MASPSAIAYCAQTPWLVNKTIQENILGSSLFESQWYAKVVKAVALLDDLKTYPTGDRTLVGSKGITLSGGQKQRIVCVLTSLVVQRELKIHRGTCEGIVFSLADSPTRRYFQWLRSYD
jgi:ABC-type bacteriocin/lantibiotic exporter with double-glycine peptidase domain